MAKAVRRTKQIGQRRMNSAQAVKRRQANVAGYAKRSEARAKKSVDTLDVYEYATERNKRADVTLELDRGEEVADQESEVEGEDTVANYIGDGDGVVKSEDDEEIDSDEAFEGESDEERFASFKFSPKKEPAQARKRTKPVRNSANASLKRIDLNEDEITAPLNNNSAADGSEETDSGDDMENKGDFLDLSRMLEGAHGDDEDDSDDEEGTVQDGEEEDESDEKETPQVVQRRRESPVESDGEEEEGDALQKLESFIDTLGGKKHKLSDEDIVPERRLKRRIIEERTETVPEGAFSAPTGPQLGMKKLALEQLLAPLADDSSATAFHALKKATKALASASKSGPLPAPLPYRAQEKLDRQAAYEKTKEEVEKWGPAMRRIREAEHLAFPLQPPPISRPTNSELTAKFQPSNEMESAVDRLLKEANMRDQDMGKTEELAMNHLSVEEVAARRAELRQMRELMFRAEAKAKRVAKIKSKTYRRIHKKLREKGKDALDQMDLDQDTAQQERAALEVDRAKERATMRHKNTGKWAKAMLSRGELDIDQRRDINDQLERGELLRKKILGLEGSSDEEDDDVDEAEGSDLGHIKAGAFDELHRLDDDATARAEVLEGKHSGLFQMKFMQDAQLREQGVADRTVDDFKRELAKLGVDDASPEDQDAVQDPQAFTLVNGNRGRRVFGANASGVQQISTILQDDYTLPAGHEPDRSPEPDLALRVEANRPTATTGANPWLSASSTTKLSRKKNNVVVSKNSSFADKSTNALKQQMSKSEASRQLDKEDAVLEISMEHVLKIDNSKRPDGPRKEQAKTLKRKAQGSSADVIDPAYEASDTDEEEPPIKEMRAFSQRDLVAQAFEGDNVIQDFEEEKRREVEADAPRVEDITLPGWGSWGGQGVKPSSKRVLKQVPGVDPTKRADAGKANVIISERKDKKGAKYQVKDLPWPYTNKAQFERLVDTPVGAEWNTRTMHQRLTMPRVVKKMGTIIDPVEKLF